MKILLYYECSYCWTFNTDLMIIENITLIIYLSVKLFKVRKYNLIN